MIEPNNLNFDDLTEGYQQIFEHLITVEEVDTFAKLTGDFNPVHVDNEYAKKTNFGKRVVHGMLTSSFISTMIGMRIPGPGALWLSQTLNFLNPTYIGDTITVKAVVLKVSKSTRTISLFILITNQNGLKVVEGEAVVKILEINNNNNNLINMNKNKIVLVTGGNRGIGAATSLKLAEEGYFVVINYLHGKDEAEQIISEITAKNQKAIAIQGDVSIWNDVDNLFNKVETEIGPILYVVHSASPSPKPQNFENLNWDVFDLNINVQLKGSFNCVKRSLSNMIENKFGVFINIGSIFTDGMPPVNQTPYVVIKSALSSFSRTMAAEYGPKGLRFNTVSPGMTLTSMISNIPDKVKMLTKMNTPLRTLADPNDIANAIEFLLSPKASHITGENLRVCGGLFMS
jgi:3-oxoacyl-[acyl-carrier protein] reductase